MMIDPVTINIDVENSPSEIVKRYYRTAFVFKKHGLEFCCGGKWPLKMKYDVNAPEVNLLIDELKESAHIVQLPASLPFDEWKIDFLIEYIINIHHYYLRHTIPVIAEQLHQFVDEHKKKYPFLTDLETTFLLLEKKMVPHLNQEEEIIFPYIRQLAHAYESKESYAGLLVRTLKKPVEEMMDQEHHFTKMILMRFRELTNNYTVPAGGCTSHHLCFSLLRELDDDLVQHLHLENDILFPKAIRIEKELQEKE